MLEKKRDTRESYNIYKMIVTQVSSSEVLLLRRLHVAHSRVAGCSCYATHVVVIAQYPHVATLSPGSPPTVMENEYSHNHKVKI